LISPSISEKARIIQVIKNFLLILLKIVNQKTETIVNKPIIKPTNNCDSIVPTYNTMSADEVQLLNKSSHLVNYNVGDVLFLQNTLSSNMMYIKTGLVKIYKETDSHKRMILEIRKDGSYIGLLSVFGERIYQYSAEALGHCQIVCVELDAFRKMVERNGSYAHKIMKHISDEGLFILEKLMTQYQKQLPGRIADVILYFAEVIYKNRVFDFPLSRKELAEFAGTTKESFIRTLTEFKNDLIIELDGKRVSIKSMEILKTLSKLG